MTITAWMNILTLAGAVQGVFFGLVLLRLPIGNRNANRHLAIFLLVFSCSMLGISGYFSRWVLEYPHLALLHTPFGTVLGAPFLLYLLAVSHKNFKMRLLHWLFYLPALGVFIWLIPFYILSADEKAQIIERSYTVFPDDWRYIFVISNLINFVFLIVSVLVVLRHERVVKTVYASPRYKTLRWIRHFLYAGLAIFLICVTMSFYDIAWADVWSNFCFSFLIYIFGYRAMRQPEIFGDIEDGALPIEDSIALVSVAPKYEKSGLSEIQAQLLLGKLEQLMTVDQLYLDPELNLATLARQLGVAPYQCSQLINQYRNENFSDFVNRYRVEHFSKAIKNPENNHLSILSIAYDAGFNSKAAFNAVFKKMTGLTPSQMR